MSLNCNIQKRTAKPFVKAVPLSVHKINCDWIVKVIPDNDISPMEGHYFGPMIAADDENKTFYVWESCVLNVGINYIFIKCNNYLEPQTIISKTSNYNIQSKNAKIESIVKIKDMPTYLLNNGWHLIIIPHGQQSPMQNHGLDSVIVINEDSKTFYARWLWATSVEIDNVILACNIYLSNSGE